MTWMEKRLSLRLAAEERAGYTMRERQRIARAQEDAAYASLATAVGP